jgi:hypothetical protein
VGGQVWWRRFAWTQGYGGCGCCFCGSYGLDHGGKKCFVINIELITRINIELMTRINIELM